MSMVAVAGSRFSDAKTYEFAFDARENSTRPTHFTSLNLNRFEMLFVNTVKIDNASVAISAPLISNPFVAVFDGAQSAPDDAAWKRSTFGFKLSGSFETRMESIILDGESMTIDNDHMFEIALFKYGMAAVSVGTVTGVAMKLLTYNIGVGLSGCIVGIGLVLAGSAAERRSHGR